VPLLQQKLTKPNSRYILTPMTSTLIEYDADLLPEHLRDNEYHPAADKYMHSVREIQQALVTVSRSMKPIEVNAVKLHHQGETNTHIAEVVKRSGSWVSKAIDTVKARSLLSLLGYYREAIDGPKDAQRAAMLWRIAIDAEEANPRTAIAAVGELNKMKALGYAQQQAGNYNTPVTIIINQESMPRTALDN